MSASCVQQYDPIDKKKQASSNESGSADDDMYRRIYAITSILRDDRVDYLTITLDVFLLDECSLHSGETKVYQKYKFLFASESSAIISKLPVTGPNEFNTLIRSTQLLQDMEVNGSGRSVNCSFRCANINFASVEPNIDSLIIVDNQVLPYTLTSFMGYNVYFGYERDENVDIMALSSSSSLMSSSSS